MARQTTQRSQNTTSAQPTAAMKLAMAFDAGKSAFIEDAKRPATESRTKQVGAVALVAGLAIGAWELAGF